MPDIVTHYFVGLLISSRSARLRYALILALAGLLPDVDALFFTHRWATHSIAVVLPIVVALNIAVLKLYRNHLVYSTTASLLYLLHIVLDMFTAPTPILWPLYSQSIAIALNIDGSLTSRGIEVIAEVGISSSYVDFGRKQVIEGPLFTAEGAVIAIAITSALILEHILGRVKRCK